LALLAHAFLAVLAGTQADHGNPDDDQLIPLTCNEIRRLFTGPCQQPAAPRIQLHWSRWRRRHQSPPGPATTGNEPDLAHIRDGNDAEPDRWHTVMTDSRQQLRRQVSMLEV
jgi:hypothetical protein